MMEANDIRKEALSLTLLLFLVVIAAYIWFLNLMTQERVFGFLISAEMVVFSMLVYTYYKPDFDELSRTWLLMASIAVVELLIFSVIVTG